MNTQEIYRVQEKFKGAKKTEWHFCYWLPPHNTLEDAREHLRYARADAEHGETYRIIHEIRQWEYFR